jgi:hypothetical protein
LWNWVTLKGYNLLGVGTSLKFYIASGGVYYDITPLTSNSPAALGADPFNLTAGSSTVTVTNTAFGAQTGAFVTFSGATSTDANITAEVLNQQYQLTRVDANTYTFQARAAGTSIEAPGAFVLADATNIAVGGSSVTAKYAVGGGGSTSTIGVGWNVGPWSPYLSKALTNPFTGFGPYTTTGRSTASGIVTLTFASATAIPVGTTIVVSGVRPTGYNTPNGAIVTASTTTSVSYVNATTASITVQGKINVAALKVTQTAHGLATNDWVTFASIASNPCGINKAVLQKAFQITKVDDDNYTVSTAIRPTAAFIYTTTTTAASGGAVTVQYPDITKEASYNRGWGTGYGTAADGTTLQLRLWSQANFGEKLLFSYRGGPIYLWSPGNAATPAYATPGAVVTGSDVPALVNQVLVSDASRIVICLGCNDYGVTTTLDPLLIRWSTNESYTNWTPSPANQAGSFRLSRGSRIVAGLQTRQEILVCTDTALYSMQYLGPPYVFGVTLLADNISIISPNAMATANGVTYWMGQDKFYVYSGRVETLPCALRSYVFDDINQAQSTQFFAGTNEGYSEIFWFYCSITGANGVGTVTNPNTAIDRYVIFNYLDRVWYYGKLNRTAWLDSALQQGPQATTSVEWAALTEDIDDAVTTVPVNATASFPNAGTIQIDNELITYTNTTPVSFLNCVRGVQVGGTRSVADYHVANTNVKLYASNLLIQHEVAVDDGTTNPPLPIPAYIQSSDFDIGDGHNYGFVWQIVPDITFDGSNTAIPNYPNVTFTIRPRQNPGSNYGAAVSPTVASTVSYAQVQTYNVQQFTELVYTRARGRQMAFRIDSNTLGTQWQLGTPRMNVRPDGRR